MVRRRQILAGSAGLFASALAGCTAGGSADSESTAAAESETEAATESTTTEQTTESAGQYTVEIEPNDPYTFEAVPETYGVASGPFLDMGMALGIHPSATTGLERAPLKFYDLLGLEFDESRITKLASGAESGFDKENFYAADADVWLIARATLGRYVSWDASDYEEVESQTGPFLGTTLRFAPTAAVSNEPNPYTLYEAFEKVATVFQRRQQFQAWQSFHDDLMSTIEAGLPPEDERPTVAAIWRGVSPDSGQFRVAPLHRLGNNTKSYFRVGMKDAFEGRYPEGPIGYEELINVDPDYIGAVGALTSSTHEEFVDTVVEPFENNESGQRLTAVQEGNLIRSAGQYMGPIVDMFSTEAVAKMVYPDQFGEWPGAVGDVPEDEQLFDRERLVDIVNGNF
ncbi:MULTISPECIES: ABC transporter substrate-binding protein [Haloferax]|uniref:ABC transporter substrate-binding protein n=1 Tax=Haloferax volcanii TaxID=2246 RepID=A0A558G2W3_HALVO|nr:MULTISPECIES: ABC transporter substrate-binding protein [Haloferax]ELK53743.1 iron ABC transporter substrate-binding protein [Haloferax sp. BAB-2207]MBC9988058.1 ferrichrome ABC transporter substrate-binding protein [Haloferax sp. AS1]NLV03057.1 ABC transporter substrate-binding protein [Haloferax alexandrinus]TVT92102.1 ABC transporter substrate-binding protein [Haloferax volcanii]